MIYFIRFLHLLSLVVWIGGVIFFSFFAAPSIFKVLPRETAGDVIGAIFPKYWLIGYICSLVALISIIILSIIEIGIPIFRIGLLIIMTAITYYSGLVVGSKARDIKAEIRVAEDSGKKGILSVEFKSLHRRSVILNVILLILGLVYIYLTAYYIRV